MHNARLLIFPLGGLALMVAVALVLTWLTATPDERDDMSQWISGRIGNEEPEAVRQIDWASLPPEIIAWVEVPGTNTDEPIVQADAAYPNRWLYADVFGDGGYGTPYIDCDCSLEGPFTIVYGHHMDDGSVFADFAGYSDPTYAENHGVIYLYTRADGPAPRAEGGCRKCRQRELRVAADGLQGPRGVRGLRRPVPRRERGRARETDGH